MTSGQVVGQLLNSASAVTALTATRIYNGSRPGGSAASIFPCINYFEMAGGNRRWGLEKTFYSINCRAVTAETALQLARGVDELFNGTSGTGIYGYTTTVSNFEVSRAFTTQRQGLIPEPDSGVYNAPVDVCLIFPASSIS